MRLKKLLIILLFFNLQTIISQEDIAQRIIDHLGLIAHIEGGYFKQTYKSPINFSSNNGIRSLGTEIYYLLKSDDFSCWHRLKSDEIWHYYCGSDVIIYQIDQEGQLTSTVIGNMIHNEHAVPQCLIPAENWFAATPLSLQSFSLVGATVFPGFEYNDFEIGEREDLLTKFPQYKDLIMQFTR